MHRIAGTTLIVLVVAGCSTPSPVPPVVTSSSAGTPMPGVELPDDILVLRAWSGPWEDPRERVGRVRATLVVYRDGLVVADASPVGDRQEFRAARLDKAELIALHSRLALVQPVSFEHASSLNSGCMDCGVQVIRVWNGDRAIEIAVYGLSTQIDVVPDGTPPSAVALSELDELEGTMADRPAVAFDRPIPLIPAAPQVGG